MTLLGREMLIGGKTASISGGFGVARDAMSGVLVPGAALNLILVQMVQLVLVGRVILQRATNTRCLNLSARCQ